MLTYCCFECVTYSPSSYKPCLVSSCVTLDIGVACLEDGSEHGLGRCTSHKESIYIFQLDQLEGIRSSHIATIHDTSDFSLLASNIFLNPISDKERNLLGLVGTGNITCVHGPQWFVYDDHL